MKKRITITLDEDVFSRFREYCGQNGMKVSSKIEKLIEGLIGEQLPEKHAHLQKKFQKR